MKYEFMNIPPKRDPMAVEEVKNEQVRVEVLGIGSARNRELVDNLERAIKDMQLDIPFRQVEDLGTLLQYEISGIPALVIDGKVVFQQVVPSVEDLRIALTVMLGNGHSSFPLSHILVPTDFSEVADNALEYALALCEAQGGHVRLLHVHQPQPQPGMALGNPMISVPDESLQIKQEWIATRIKRYGHLPAWEQTHEDDILQVGGTVSESIRQLAGQWPVDMVVMGTTGARSLPDRWLGSVSSSTARKVDCPVLLVPEGVYYRPFRRIVYASEFNQGEEQIWPKLVSFAAKFGADLHFVHIQAQQLGGYLLKRSQRGMMPRKDQVGFSVSTVESPDLMEGLSRYLKEQEADLLVMSTHKRTLLQNLLHRSATRRMASSIDLPLMVLHFEA